VSAGIIDLIKTHWRILIGGGLIATIIFIIAELIHPTYGVVVN